MKASTHAIIGLAVVALGIGVYALGMAEGQSNVRQLWDVLEDPDAHMEGDYVLIGIPQPESLEGPNGTRANPERGHETRTITAWQDGDVRMQATLILRAAAIDGGTRFTFENHTQVQGDPATRNVTQHIEWDLTSPHTLFYIQGFPDESGTVPAVWGIYEGTLRDPIQPKPSQFEGRLVSHVGGHEVPAGVPVFWIDEYTAGCSSKFLPDDHEPT